MRITKNRQTGTFITVGRADEVGLDDGDGHTRWYTICEMHSSAVGHQTKRLAESFAASPIDWCESCADPHAWCDRHDYPTRSCDCWNRG